MLSPRPARSPALRRGTLTRLVLATLALAAAVSACGRATDPTAIRSLRDEGEAARGGTKPPPPPTPPPPPSGTEVPVVLTPADGAAMVQPVPLSWNAATAVTRIIGYNWEVATSSTFGAVIDWGSTFEFATASPSALHADVSGLANGTYFWHVQSVQQGGALGPVQSAWSAARSFTVTGPGSAPGTTTVSLPLATAQFHPWELFDFSWSAVPGAAYYLLEMDNEPSFAQPWANATNDHILGTTTQLSTVPGTIYYRIRAVGADGMRGIPSPTRTVVVSYTAPLPPPPTPTGPLNGLHVSVPFNLTWSDPNSAEGGGYYEAQISTTSSFSTVQWYVIGASDSPFAVDDLSNGFLVTPGTKFWRIRAYHGYSSPGTPAITKWSSTGTFVVQ